MASILFEVNARADVLKEKDSCEAKAPCFKNKTIFGSDRGLRAFEAFS